MSVVEFSEAYVCVDCAMAIANADYTGMDDETECRVRDALATSDGQWVIGDGENDHDFSWMRCDCCHSTLGGTRLQAFFGVPVEDDL